MELKKKDIYSNYQQIIAVPDAFINLFVIVTIKDRFIASSIWSTYIHL